MKRKNSEIDSFFSLFFFRLINSIGFLYMITIVITCIKFSLGAVTNYHKTIQIYYLSFVGQKSGWASSSDLGLTE